MLSNVDIVKEIKKKNIAISPLTKDTIKGASVNLTASDIAWSLQTRKKIEAHDNKITIPPHDTALILTRELVACTEKIGGTYHSRVGDVSSGKGHIGTTLNPGWIGYSLIAVTNHTDEKRFVEVGKPFVTLVFEYVNSPSTIIEDNKSNRSDIVLKLGLESNESYNNLDDKNLNLKRYMDNYLSDTSGDEYKSFVWYYNEIVKKHRVRKFFAQNYLMMIVICCLWGLFFVLKSFASIQENYMNMIFGSILTITTTFFIPFFHRRNNG
jgi:deoxycytidine triphosphate deaminase